MDGLNYLVGKRKTITQTILKNIEKIGGFILLPTSLNDLASMDDDKKLRKSYQKIDFCVTDGMPLVWYFNLRSLFKRKMPFAERIYGPDLMKDILKSSNKDTIHFFYGSSKKTLFELEKNLKNLFPNTKIAKMISPPFRKLSLLEEAKFIVKVRKSRADVLWIGLSSPKQVVLAARWSNFLPNTKIFCVGAAFDFLSKRQAIAPRTVQNLGLEWLFRLIADPLRLWKRYLVLIPKFILKRIYSFFFN